MDRLAFRAPQAENLYPADAQLNLPARLHSHEVAKLAAIESARGSFHDAAEALTRACGAPVAAPQAVRAMAITAARDFAAFYDHTAPMMSDAGTPLAISVDDKTDTAVAEWALTVLNGRSADVVDELAASADARPDFVAAAPTPTTTRGSGCRQLHPSATTARR